MIRRESMPFAYDVFFSYRRHSAYMGWLADFFFDRFTADLNTFLDHAPRVFFDTNTVKVGAHWPTALQDALATSRCMVALWAPDYFRSYYCYNEWRNFQRHRNGFILPLQYSLNRNKFPIEAQELNIADFSPYAFTGDGFRKSQAFFDYQMAIRKFAGEVADAIERAPAEPPPFALKSEVPPNADQSDVLIPLGAPVVNAAVA
jgi:hypothetical protein